MIANNTLFIVFFFKMLMEAMPRNVLRFLYVYERMLLEFLTKNEVEVASSVCAYTMYFVETICPVDTKKSDHG